MDLFRKSPHDDHIPELDFLASRELALRSRKVALTLVPMTILVTFITDLKGQFSNPAALVTLLFLCVGLFRLSLAERFEASYQASPRSWLHQFSAAATLPAVVLGLSLPLIFLNMGGGWTFIICLLAITGTAASATGSLSPNLGLFRIFVVVLVLPIIVTLLAFGEVKEMGLGFLTLVFLGQILLLGNHFHHELWTRLRGTHLLQERAAALEKANIQVKAANEAKSEFLTNMSHEMRTPLNGILGLTELILETDLQTRQEEYLRDVRSSGQSLLQIVNELLDYSTIESGQIILETSVFSLPEMLKKVAVAGELNCRIRGNSLSLHMEEGFPQQVLGDPQRIRQILTNLVDNAAKFTELGKVEVEGVLDRRQDGLVAFTIHVRDTGIGIPPEAKKKVFKAFSQADGSTTRNFGGTGLGLAISSQLAELMGGKITLASSPGKGSLFSLHLALPEPKAQLDAQPTRDPHTGAPTNDISLKGLRVLMAEDNTVNAKLAKRLLEKWDISVVWARNGQEAVSRYSYGNIDLVLMDIQMPILDGFGATVAIREIEAATGVRVPIIALTAHAMEGYRENCLAAGMDDYLTKPLQPKILRETLETWSTRKFSLSPD